MSTTAASASAIDLGPMKKKYGLFAIIVFVSIVFDLGTKTIAENNLASRTRDYEHYLYIGVPDDAAEQSLRDFLVQELTWNSDDEVEEITNQSTFIVDDEGNWVRRGFAELSLEGGERVEIRERSVEMVDGFLYFRYTENRGAAWGFLSGFDSDLRQPFFIGVGIIAMVVIFFLFRTVKPDRILLITALSLIVGGAMGNIVDRIRYGYVVDFIKWYPGFEWPTFNIADALICVGVGLMFIQVIRDSIAQGKAAKEEKRSEKKKKA